MSEPEGGESLASVNTFFPAQSTAFDFAAFLAVLFALRARGPLTYGQYNVLQRLRRDLQLSEEFFNQQVTERIAVTQPAPAAEPSPGDSRYLPVSAMCCHFCNVLLVNSEKCMVLLLWHVYVCR